MAKRTQKPPGTCIFCGRTGLSKEHVWSNWLKEVIQRHESHTERSQGYRFIRDPKEIKVTAPLHEKTKQGCGTQRKVRKVCERHCNNGWMGRIVENAKPIAKKIILGERCQIDENEMAKLASWIAITTIMQEFMTQSVVIPAEDRISLMETMIPPFHWTILLGFYGGVAWDPMGVSHIPAKLGNKTLEEGGSKKNLPESYFQTTTFAIRNMLVQVFTATNGGTITHYREHIPGFNWNVAQLWPVASARIAWPRFPVLDAELRRILFQYLTDGLGIEVNVRLSANNGLSI